MTAMWSVLGSGNTLARWTQGRCKPKLFSSQFSLDRGGQWSDEERKVEQRNTEQDLAADTETTSQPPRLFTLQ